MSNKSNGISAVSANSSLYHKEQKNQKSTSALPTFFRWFRKSNHRKSFKRQINTTQSAIESQYDSSSRESLNSSPKLGKLHKKFISPSISCDSVISTSTTGFSYIKPNNYEQNKEPKILNNHNLNEELSTNETLKRPQLSLRQKYSFLFQSDTLKSNNEPEPTYSGNYDNVNYNYPIDRSLPNRRKDTEEPTAPSRRTRGQRRTVSDSSKDKKSGAYIHVKGKRKAPGPPPTTHSSSDTTRSSLTSPQEQIYNRSLLSYQSSYGTLSSYSTLGRKKRRAPQPPSRQREVENEQKESLAHSLPDSSEEIKFPILKEGLLDDKEIRAIINGSIAHDSQELNTKENYEESKVLNKELFSSRLQQEPTQIVGNEVVKDEQKMYRQLNEEQLERNGVENGMENVRTSSPTVTPRPWYKRPMSTNRESIIPFKREIVLRTMEKRKRPKGSINNDNLLPEVSYSRSSPVITDTKGSGIKFGIFHRISKDYSSAEKRKSAGIYMPNISELDREAVEILRKENSEIKSKRNSALPDHLILQQKMFVAVNENLNGDKNNHVDIESKHEHNKNNERIEDADQNVNNNNVDEERQCKSTKDLVTKFESTAILPKVTINPNFLKSTNDDKDLESNRMERSQIPRKTDLESKKLYKNCNEENGKVAETFHLTKLTWSCPYCTLENPGWRIICEVCEKLKPYEMLTSREQCTENQNQESNKSIELSKSDSKISNFEEKNLSNGLIKPEPLKFNNEWNKKAEQVKKYFMASPKSSPEVTRKPPQSPSYRKSPSPSKLPISNSPKFGRHRLHRIQNIESKPNNVISNFKKSDNFFNFKEEDFKTPLLDSSVIVTSVTPVFYATTEINNPIETNLEQIRNARLARFCKQQPLEYPFNDSTPSNSTPSNSTPSDSTPSGSASSISNQFNDQINDNTLEMEKKRLREKIRAMNAKALAEKYPIVKKSLSLDEPEENQYHNCDGNFKSGTDSAVKIETSKNGAIDSSENVSNSGAIKKIFNKNQNNCVSKSSPKIIEKKAEIERPKKVSSSAQTPSVVKKEEFYSNLQKLKNKLNDDPIYSNVHTYENQKFGSPTKIDNIEQNYKDFEKVQAISEQLKSAKAINEFRETLKTPIIKSGLSRTDTLVLNKMLRNLEVAICEGKHELAAKLAIDLAKLKVSLQVTKIKKEVKLNGEQQSNKNQNLIIDLFVEDRVSQKGPIKISINPSMTIRELKEKTFKDFDIPIEVQRWLINDELLYDEDQTLLKCGVRDETANMYLYIVNPQIGKEIKFKIPESSKAVPEDDNISGSDSDSHNNEEDFYKGAVAPRSKNIKKIIQPIQIAASSNNNNNDCIEWECSLCTLINKPMALACSACSKSKPLSKEEKSLISEELRKFISESNSRTLLTSSLFADEVRLRRNEQKNDLNKITPNRKSTDIYNIVVDILPKPKNEDDELKKIEHIKPTALPSNISYPVIVGETKKLQTPQQFPIKLVSTTFLQCSPSPNITKSKYRGVDNFNPYRKDVSTEVVNRNGAAGEAKIGSNIKSPYTNNHYLELLKLDTSDFIPNSNEFSCSVCFNEVLIGNGAILKNCLHIFCKDCLRNTIKYSEDAEVKCPEFNCESFIQEREIKGLLSPQDYDKHLAKSIQVAEHRIENAFHCKTPNCRGWCIYEDNVNQFRCPVCKITNCLTCRVIHDGLTCKQYQDRLNTDCDSNLEARRTRDMLKEMVERGEAMNCPTCQVIMMKKWGCDWLKCSMCKTEVCWVTRGPRWGPAGKGDTSGGCRCGVNGVKCHAKCNYCH